MLKSINLFENYYKCLGLTAIGVDGILAAEANFQVVQNSWLVEV